MPGFDDHTLDYWREHVVEFVETHIIDPKTGRPFVLLEAEKAFLRFAFQRDANGRLKYPELLYACPKKSGKTTFAGIFILVLLVLFADQFGEAVCCANDYEQAASRVHQVVRRIVECSPLLRGVARLTADKITLDDAVIRAIPNDYASAAGSEQNIAVFDELWAFASERARRLFDELVPVPTKEISCRLTVTYAGFENESELLLELYKRGLEQPLVGTDLYAGDGILMFWSHTPIAPWQDAAWLRDMRRSLRPNQYQRMIECRFTTSESSFIDMELWDRCIDHYLSHVIADRSLPVFVGVDASIKRDSTALVCCTWQQSTQRVLLIAHKVFQPSPEEPLDFEASVEKTLLDWHKRFNVKAVLFDPYQMVSSAQRLVKAGVKMEEYPQTVPNLTEMGQNLFELIKGNNLLVYPDDGMRTAISRTVAIETPRGWRLGKNQQNHKIDVVIALALAAFATVRAQSGHGYDVSYKAFLPDFDDVDDPYGIDAWRAMRNSWYLMSGGQVRL